nr:lysophospholipid acyltransferase family protein [Brevibacillus fulvus]
MYRFFWKLFHIFFSVFFRWQVIGVEHIPKEGPVILCSNHISVLDPPLIGSCFRRKIHYMAKEELFRIPVLSFLIKKFGAFPVKRGVGDRTALRSALQLLEQGKLFGIFPEGTRSKDGRLGKGYTGVGLIVHKSDAPVIPVAIIGSYRLFQPLTVVFGKPIDFYQQRAMSASADTYKLTTEKIMAEIQTLLDRHRL